jgi:2-keto-3-deoxy-L-rhamnonate aldolase RhmA
MFNLFLITNSPEIAARASSCGVDKIMVDLEILGKEERQGHLNTVISSHTIDDVIAVRQRVPFGNLVVRINPIHPDTENEIDRVVNAGADIIMLPMFRNVEEVKRFTKAVDFRAKTCLLVETVGAMNSLKECLEIPGIDRVHIGLNDLHLELGNKFMFEPLANGLVDYMSTIIQNAGKPFGIGGIARINEGILSSELIIADHVRLGSTAAILSRTFHRQATSVADIESQMDFAQEVLKLKKTYLKYCSTSKIELDKLHNDLKYRVTQITMPSFV